jgi:hypothetical protein
MLKMLGAELREYAFTVPRRNYRGRSGEDFRGVTSISECVAHPEACEKPVDFASRKVCGQPLQKPCVKNLMP